jgi:hypothetical protein
MTQTILSSWGGRRSNSKAGAWISTLAAAALTADRIDYWIRRHVIQYWHQAHPSQQKLSPVKLAGSEPVALAWLTAPTPHRSGSDEQMFGEEEQVRRGGQSD